MSAINSYNKWKNEIKLFYVNGAGGFNSDQLGNTRSKNESGYRESYPERGLYKWILAKEKHGRRAI